MKNFTPSLLRPDMKHDRLKKPEKRKAKNIYSFAPASQHEDDEATWRSEESEEGQAEKFFRALLLFTNTKMTKRRSEKLGRWQAEKISNAFVHATRQK